MSNENPTLTQKSLDEFYAEIEGDTNADVSEKIKYLRASKPSTGLAIARYPSGTVLAVLQRVNRRMKDEHLETDYYFMKAAHGAAFLLVKKGTDQYAKCVDAKANTGGINSTDVVDLGEFLIVQVEEGSIIEGDAFSLYKVADDFLD